MTPHSMLRAGALLAFASLLAACSTTGPAAPDVPPPASTSTDQAQQRLAAVAAERRAIETRYAEREVICYEKFFVTSCLDDAREQQRVALLEQRAIEIEASRYLRQAKVDERDRAIAAADAAFQEEEAKMAAEAAPVRKPAAVPPPRKPAVARTVQNGQRAQDTAARAEKDAAERAANVAAYEERRRKSEARQQEVARRVAERDAKAARRAQEEAQKKAPTAPLTTE